MGSEPGVRFLVEGLDNLARAVTLRTLSFGMLQSYHLCRPIPDPTNHKVGYRQKEVWYLPTGICKTRRAGGILHAYQEVDTARDARLEKASEIFGETQ